MNWQKIKQKLSNTLRLKFRYLKIIHFLYPRYPLNIIRDILMYKKKCVYFNNVISPWADTFLWVPSEDKT